METYKSSNENSLKFNIKKLHNELSDKEEQIHFLLSKNKENELRLIISSNKINESKNTNSKLKNKVNEQKKYIDSVLKDIKDKNEENENINNELNKIKLELNSLKEINKKKKNMLDFEIKKNEEFENIKKMSEFTDINIDVNALIKENEILINKENEKLFKK